MEGIWILQTHEIYTVSSGKERKTKKLAGTDAEVCGSLSLCLQSEYYCWHSGSSRSVHVTLHPSPFPGSFSHPHFGEHREWNHPEDATAGTVPSSGLWRASSQFLAF